MGTMKSTGGLTRGRGIDESQCTQWVFALAACSSINGAMHDLTGIDGSTSEQHKECTTASQTRDDRDIRTLHDYLRHRSPFERDASLQNIATGVTADISVNADSAVIRKFHKPTIVFDGYEASLSTKDVAHLRRSGGMAGTTVNFEGSMLIKSKKGHFLANKVNKQRFVFMLSKTFRLHGAILCMQKVMPICVLPQQL